MSHIWRCSDFDVYFYLMTHSLSKFNTDSKNRGYAVIMRENGAQMAPVTLGEMKFKGLEIPMIYIPFERIFYADQ